MHEVDRSASKPHQLWREPSRNSRTRARSGAVQGRGVSHSDGQLERLAVAALNGCVLAEAQLEDAVESVDHVLAGLCRSRPWLIAPGTSGIVAIIQPSPASSNTIVSRSGSIIALGKVARATREAKGPAPPNDTLSAFVVGWQMPEVLIEHVGADRLDTETNGSSRKRKISSAAASLHASTISRSCSLAIEPERVQELFRPDRPGERGAGGLKRPDAVLSPRCRWTPPRRSQPARSTPERRKRLKGEGAGGASTPVSHRPMTALLAAGRSRDVQVFADPAGGAGLDLVVPRNGCDPLAVGSADGPDAVTGTFALYFRAVGAEVSFEIAALHAAIVSSSGSLSAGLMCSGGAAFRSPRLER